MADTPHLDGLARQIADGANRRLTPQANPFSDRSYSEDVVGIDPVTLSMILALLQWVAKRCVHRALVRRSRHDPGRARVRAMRVVANCDSTSHLPHATQMAIAEATADAVVHANDGTLDLIEQEIGWAEVAGE